MNIMYKIPEVITFNPLINPFGCDDCTMGGNVKNFG